MRTQNSRQNRTKQDAHAQTQTRAVATDLFTLDVYFVLVQKSLKLVTFLIIFCVIAVGEAGGTQLTALRYDNINCSLQVSDFFLAPSRSTRSFMVTTPESS